MSTDTTLNVLNLQLRALADIQRALQTNSDRLIRVEGRIDQIARDVDRLSRKGNEKTA